MFHIFFSENRAVYEIMSKNVGEPERPQMTIRRRVTCWVSMATCAQARGCARAATTPPPHTHTHERTRTHPRERETLQKYVILMIFHDNDGFANAPRCYVIRTLPVLLIDTPKLNVTTNTWTRICRPNYNKIWLDCRCKTNSELQLDGSVQLA